MYIRVDYKSSGLIVKPNTAEWFASTAERSKSQAEFSRVFPGQAEIEWGRIYQGDEVCQRPSINRMRSVDLNQLRMRPVYLNQPISMNRANQPSVLQAKPSEGKRILSRAGEPSQEMSVLQVKANTAEWITSQAEPRQRK